MKKSILTLGIIMLFCTAVFAQTPNTFRDTTFELQFSGLSGGLMFDVGELPKTKILPLSDGKILIYGGLRNPLQTEISGVARLNEDGSWDSSFDAPDFDQDYYIKVRVVKELDDGKYLIAGEFTDFSGGTNQMGIIKLNNDGSHDMSFDADVMVSSITAMDVQPDGKILVNLITAQGRVTRLHSNGSIDTTFHADISSYTNVSRIQVLPNGQILINGYRVLNSDGTFHANLPSEGLTEFQPDGKIISAGFSSSNTIKISRFNTDYTIDSTFHIASNTSNSGNYVAGLSVQNDGKIVVSGYFIKAYDGNNDVSGIFRLNPDGTLDTTFNTQNGFGNASHVFHSTLQADGKILLVTENATYQGEGLRMGDGFSTNQVIIRLNGDGGGTTSVENIKDEFSFNIYPNPANDFVTITNLPIGSTMRILDITGKVVYSSAITNEQTTTINTTDFINGIYLIRIENNGNIANRKLVVNK